jgi:hypothetical protein
MSPIQIFVLLFLFAELRPLTIASITGRRAKGEMGLVVAAADPAVVGGRDVVDCTVELAAGNANATDTMGTTGKSYQGYS